MTKLKSIVLLTLFLSLSVNILGQDRVNISDTLKIYIDKKARVYLNGEKSSISKIEKNIERDKPQNAKLATVFPTPMKVFAIVEKTNQILDKNSIKTEWYKDPKFTIPAWE